MSSDIQTRRGDMAAVAAALGVDGGLFVAPFQTNDGAFVGLIATAPYGSGADLLLDEAAAALGTAAGCWAALVKSRGNTIMLIAHEDQAFVARKIAFLRSHLSDLQASLGAELQIVEVPPAPELTLGDHIERKWRAYGEGEL